MLEFIVAILVFFGLNAYFEVPPPAAIEAPVIESAEPAPETMAEPAPPPTPDLELSGDSTGNETTAVARPPEPQVPTGRSTTAVEVKPILNATRAQWIAIREYEGQDLLYFSQLASWRCGLWEVRYGLNGAAPTTSVPLEPCHEDTAAPNAVTGDPTALYIAQPLGSIDSVEIEIVYDDGTIDAAVFARLMVLSP